MRDYFPYVACTRHVENSTGVEAAAWNQGLEPRGPDWHLEVVTGKSGGLVNLDLNGDETPDESPGGHESLVLPSDTPADPTNKSAVERSFHVIERFLGRSPGLPYVAEPEEQEPRIADEGPRRSGGIILIEDEPLAFLSSSECDEFIARRSGIDLATVAVVMAVEYEFMYGRGLIVGPEPPWVYYAKDELVGEAPVVDTLRLAREAERRAGVPEGVAHVVLEWELRFLEQEGLAE